MFNKISQKEINDFNRVLSLLMLSRIPIINSFNLIIAQTKNEKFKEILKKINSDLKTGYSLSKAFAKYTSLFSEIYISNLKVAEETGNVAEVLNEYTDYQEKFLALKRKISQASRYPLFVIAVSFAVISFMLFFLMPTFESLFKSVKADLPPLTQFLLSISNYFVENGLIVLFLILGLAIVSKYLIKLPTIKNNFLDKIIFYLPYISTLFVRNLLARFSLSMAVLLKNGVGLLEALKISKNVSNNSVFKEEINFFIRRLIKGESLTANVKDSRFFDITYTRLLAAGEESAELDKVFYLISDFYSKEFDHQLDNITTLIEPILILIVGSIVAVILVAMYLPMFELINYVGV